MRDMPDVIVHHYFCGRLDRRCAEPNSFPFEKTPSASKSLCNSRICPVPLGYMSGIVAATPARGTVVNPPPPRGQTRRRDMEPAIEAADPGDSRSLSGDSGYADTECTTDSLRTSVFAYEEEHGRTYHAFHAGKYVVPNDEGEQERMDLHYHSMRLSIQNKLFHAPLPAPTGILDVGTGTGIWAMDAADAYPAAEVIGFDLSPIQPTYVPANLRFEVNDAEDAWSYGEHRFSLVHTRYMNGFGLKSWPHFYREAFACLRPGGWVENQEFDAVIRSDDHTIPPDSVTQRWVTLWNEGAEKIGMTGRCRPEIQVAHMRAAGFVDVKVIPFKMPIGPWPKDPQLREAGWFGLIGLLNGIDGLSLKIFTNCLGWSTLELEVFLAQVRTELKKKSVHSYWPIYVIMGRKPERSGE